MITLLAGLMLDYISTTMSSAAGGVAILFGVIPNWQHFWMADALLRDGVIAWSYVGSAFAYAAIYSVAVLALGMFSFLRVDLK